MTHIKTNSLVDVCLDDRSYQIHIGENQLEKVGEYILPLLKRKQVHIIADCNALKFHGDKLCKSLADLQINYNIIKVESGEKSKSFHTFEQVCEEVLSLGTERGDLIIAFGGGVVGDLTGFVAGVINRGIDFVQIPTTLLSQVDSSVGGKTAINAKAGKNLIGLFWQPRMVIMDTLCLDTLVGRDILAGFAEIFKIGLLGNHKFFNYCLENYSKIIGENGEHRHYAIKTSVEAKANIVAQDEREGGVRALLNLGHTFAHAIEGGVNYDEQKWRHGEAVALGIVMAANFSHKIGVLDLQSAQIIEKFVANCGYKTKLDNNGFNAIDMLETMRHDKKNSGGAINLVLLKSIGGAYVHKNAPIDELKIFLEQECAKVEKI
jgi:3-dehydroquinate synthase